ncbi:MAG TPA: carbamoyltransferase C-terminal domain-containing protein [Gemmatimonadales bacterium]|nr:carbamoyltransferase C-terminal domain-containing protein [Gemmatimonadales bacterium]
MNVLGLGTEGDSGAAVVVDGRIVAAENEERSSRLKLVEGFPRGSIREVLHLAGLASRDLDAVLVGGTSDRFVDRLRPFEGWFQHWRGGGMPGWLKRQAGRFSRYRDRFPFLEPAYYALQSPTFARRRRAIRRVLRGEFGIDCPVRFVDHHFAHVASAYFTSGFDDALAISIDGGGDGRSSLVYEVRDGAFRCLHEVSAFHSLGNYYAYVTMLCGFTAMKHEGKVTGLAAYGEPKYVGILRRFVDEEQGTFRNRAGAVFQGALRELERSLPRGWTREDLAASVQRHFEDVVSRYVSHWVRRTGLRSVALAGGVCANVRVNQEIHRLPDVDRVFVHPGMADCGLGVGAALAASVPGVLDPAMPAAREPLRHVYLGHDLDNREIDRALDRAGLRPEPVDGELEPAVARLLAEGYVVARAAGRMEYGPRALGNRSILYQPADRGVNDWLNRNLRRTEFMPFAPAVLYEHRRACFRDTDGGEHPAEFMTMTFDCTPWMVERMPGVVHLDGTARPQLVRREVNPAYYRIIESFHHLTGLPAIVNTSFNMHEEPIVRSADDCVRAFLAGRIDYLAIGRRLVRHPQGVAHALRPAAAAAGAGHAPARLAPSTPRWKNAERL